MAETSRTTSASSERPKSLMGMKYSGRGITIGMTPEGTPFVVYTLSGRSPSSKARTLYYRTEDGRVIIETTPTDPEVLKKGNPALLLYPAIIFDGEKIAISNGVQTELVMRGSLPEALETPVKVGDIDVTSYEPDEPNYTPRITGELRGSGGHGFVSGFHIVRRAVVDGNPVRETYYYEYWLRPGIGIARTMTTYAGGNESPLLSFRGPPMEMDIASGIDAGELCGHVFSMLRGLGNDDYRVATAVLAWAPAARGELEADISIINANGDIEGPQNSHVHLR